MTDTRTWTRFTAIAAAAGVIASASAAVAADDTVNVWMNQHQTNLTATLNAKLEDTATANVTTSAIRPVIGPSVITVTTKPRHRLEIDSEA